MEKPQSRLGLVCCPSRLLAKGYIRIPLVFPSSSRTAPDLGSATSHVPQAKWANLIRLQKPNTKVAPV